MKRALIGFAAAMVLSAQAQAPLVFEVASIKPSPADGMGMRPRIGPNVLTMRGLLQDFVREAYEVEGYQVAGSPVWAGTEHFDVQAKAGGDADPHQIRLMLQTMLADRFRLRFHRETRTMSGYVLSVEKGGAKLPPPKSPGTSSTLGPIQVGLGGMVVTNASMKRLAYGLTLELASPVVDETKVEGNYDFRLRYDDVGVSSEGKASSSLGSVFTALHEIGLRLDAKKVPIEVLVIDSAERPSEN